MEPTQQLLQLPNLRRSLTTFFATIQLVGSVRSFSSSQVLAVDSRKTSYCHHSCRRCYFSSRGTASFSPYGSRLLLKPSNINDDGSNGNGDDNGPLQQQQQQSSLMPSSSLNNQWLSFRRARSEDGFGTRARNAAVNATRGDILVPLCSNLATRQSLANEGVYAGVEYEIKSLALANGDQVTTLKGLDPIAKQKVTALVQPAYPLRPDLERNDWPVNIALEDVPLWVAKGTYQAGTAIGTLALSLLVLIQAAVVAFFVQFVNVPSPSMVPALKPGNIVLVTRSIPLGKLFQPKVGDIVFFNAPKELESVVEKLQQQQQRSGDANIDNKNHYNGMGDLTLNAAAVKGNKQKLLKRVVAVPGENVGVRQSEPYVVKSSTPASSSSPSPSSKTKYRLDIVGPYSKPGLFSSISWDRPPSRLAKDEYFVAGDNGFRSVDSRVWGPLKERYITGTAQWVLWPPQDFGPLPPGPITEIEK